jgi:hypothetical protein
MRYAWPIAALFFAAPLSGFATQAVAADAARDARALAELTRCAESLDPILDFGVERIAKRCPTLIASIDGASWSALMPSDWKRSGDALTRDGLLALARLIEERARAAPLGRAPDPAVVAKVIAELGGDANLEASRWERFKRWLSRLFERRESEDEEGLFRRVFGDVEVSEAVSRVLSYSSYFLLIGFALYVVINELRVAGILRRDGRSAGARASTQTGSNRAIDLDAIAAAPLGERPGLLVRYVAQELGARSGAEGMGAKTSRELREKWRSTGGDAGSAFQTLTETADRVRYASEAPSAEELEAAAAAGAEAVRILEALPARPIGAMQSVRAPIHE